MKVGDLHRSWRTTSLIICRKSQRYQDRGILLLRSALHRSCEPISNTLLRLAVSSRSMNGICYRSRTRTSLEPAVHLGVSSPQSSKKRSPRAQTSMSALSETTVKRSRRSSRRFARMSSTCWMNPSSPRPNQANPKSSTTRCMSHAHAHARPSTIDFPPTRC